MALNWSLVDGARRNLFFTESFDVGPGCLGRSHSGRRTPATILGAQRSTIVEPVAIVTRLIFSVPLYLPTCLGRYRTDLSSSAGRPFSATHFLGPLLRANSCVLQLHVFCFPGSSLNLRAPPIKQRLALGAEATRFCVPQENGARKRRKFSYVLPIC